MNPSSGTGVPRTPSKGPLAAVFFAASSCMLASGASAATIHVDRNLASECATNYSIPARNCSGSSGRGVKTIQEAANVVVAGDVVRIRDGVYDHPTNGPTDFVRISRSGTASAPIIFEAYPGETATLRGWGFEDRDLNGDGDADGPKNGATGTLLYVSGSYVQIRGLEVTNSNKFGVVLGGNNNLLENLSVHDNWLGGIGISGNSHTVRYNEVCRTRHGGGIGIRAEATNAASANDNRIEYNLMHNDGYEPSGQKVLTFNGDPEGGGNSDGGGTSKTCHDDAPAGGNICQRNTFLGNLVWHNADDGFDVSFANSRMENNIAFDNGPEGNRGLKGLRYTVGNTYVGNVLFSNDEVGFEPRADSTISAHHQLAIRNGRIGVDIKVQGSNQSHYYNNIGYGNPQIDMQAAGDGRTNWNGLAQGDPRLVNSNPVINTNLPAGSAASRWQFLWDQFKTAFSPAAGSPLIDAGTVVSGLHCATADDDPGSPMNPNASCRHWNGAAPDIGAFEYKGGGPGLPSLSIGDASVTEGNSGTVSVVFTVSLSAASTQTVTVNYATANGSATAGSDYTAASGSLSFPAGTTSRTVSVSATGDTAAEGDEDFFVNLSGAAGASIADGQGKGTVRNDDTASASLRVNDVTVTEGNSGTLTAVFTVTLSPASSQTVTVDYATANGTALAGTDYTAAAGNLSFAPNTTSRTFSVTVTGDIAVEGNETFLVNLTNAAGATLADAQGQGTITNDDGAVSLSVSTATATPGQIVQVAVANGPGNLKDWVGLFSTSAADNVILNWKYLNDTRTAPSVGLKSATLNFPMPATPGTYNFRFFANNTYTKLATSATVTAQSSSTNASVSVNATTVAPGATVVVTVANGPGNPRDWLTLNPASASDQSYLDWKYLNGTRTAPATGLKSATVSFTMPTTPGTYNFRLLANNTFTKLATSATVTVQSASGPPVVSVNKTTAVRGSTVQVTVTNGPGNPKDWMSLYASTAPDTSYLDWKYLNGTRTAPATGLKTATLTFTMPMTPGTYNFRLFSNNTITKLATSPTVTVQ